MARNGLYTKDYITEEDYKIFIGEGLIKTVDPERVIDMMNKWNKGKITTRWYDDYGTLGFINIRFLDKSEENFKHITSLMDNYGYFPSTWLDINEKFNDINKIDFNNLVSVRYEPKFDLEYIPKKRYLYHVTDKKYIDKIKKIGLSPKTKSKIMKHPNRVYLAINQSKAKNIAQQMEDFIPKENQVMLKIDLENLPIFLRRDSQFFGGVYTTNNIPPKNIEIISLDDLDDEDLEGEED